MGRKPKRKYPHMLDQDVPVWDDWLAEYSLPTDVIQYDVRVGEGGPAHPRVTDAMRNWSINIQKKRIDAVVHRGDDVLIVEVTTAAGLRCIAQLVAYPILYAATFAPPTAPKPLLVCRKLLLDTEMILKALGIEYVVFPGEIPAP